MTKMIVSHILFETLTIKCNVHHKRLLFMMNYYCHLLHRHTVLTIFRYYYRHITYTNTSMWTVTWLKSWKSDRTPLCLYSYVLFLVKITITASHREICFDIYTTCYLLQIFTLSIIHLTIINTLKYSLTSFIGMEGVAVKSFQNKLNEVLVFSYHFM